jgi:hypothetical protein
MTTGSGDLQGALGGFLALDLGEIGSGAHRLHLARYGRGQETGTLEMVQQTDQIRRRQHLDVARPGRLRPLRRGADEPEIVGPCMERGQQHAGRRRDAAVKGQFANHTVARQRLGIDDAHRTEQRQRDRQVEMRPFLGKIGGGKIDRDPLGRERQADGGDGIAHPLPAFRHRLVGQADDDEIGQARDQLALNLDAARLKAKISDGCDGRDHERRSPFVPTSLYGAVTSCCRGV